MRVGRANVHARGPLGPRALDPLRVRASSRGPRRSSARWCLVALGWILFRFRDRPGARPSAADPRPHRARDRVDDRAGGDAADHRHPDDPGDLPDPGRRGAATALRVTVAGWQWWWEFRYPSLEVMTANELHLPVGRRSSFDLEGARRHPQLLGAAARRQARRGPRPRQPHHAHARAARRVLGPVRRVLRRLARQHAAARDRATSPAAFEQLGRAPAGAGRRSRRVTPASRARRCSRASRVRGLSHHRGRGRRRARARPHPLRQPQRLRRRPDGQHRPRTWRRGSRIPPALKPGARMPNLGLNDAEREGAGRLPDEPQVTR